mmetsp:Transcript_12827/g.30590  ORF Transcript_12827/g.30590 Transcript_12827/m.30590 type:complete len:374 (-) Transcript_12827:1744-2865(-)
MPSPGRDGMNVRIVARVVLEEFDPNLKAVADAMVANVKAAFRDVLDEIQWMTNETKDVAYEKLEKVTYQIANPAWILTDEEYRVNFEKIYGPETAAAELDAHLFDATLYVQEQTQRYSVSFFGKPFDREVIGWYRSPIDTNAFYVADWNTMTFLAGILQAPVFYPFNESDDSENAILAKTAINHGGIGAVMGHELIHGFDTRGREYNPDGLLFNWWSDVSRTEFEAKTDCVVAQFSEYVAVEKGELDDLQEDIKVDGLLTVTENTADLGGIYLGYKALLKELTEEQLQIKPLEEYGHDLTVGQLFFLGWTQVWACHETRPEERKKRVERDYHAAAAVRALGPVSNLAEYSKAFNCPPDSAVNLPARDEQCKVW